MDLLWVAHSNGGMNLSSNMLALQPRQISHAIIRGRAFKLLSVDLDYKVLR
jgi:hypothetical protein